MKRRARAIVVAVASVFVVATGAIYAASESRLRHVYVVQARVPEVVNDRASIAHGEHLMRAALDCMYCHGDDLGGAEFLRGAPIGVYAGSNLTRGDGGLPASYTDADFVRAIRYGIRSDGRAIGMMPSNSYMALSDADLASIIAYVRSVPPVERHVAPSSYGPLVRALIATRVLPLNAEILHDRLPPTDAPPRGATAEYGAYLAEISVCTTCHGADLHGKALPGKPAAPDIAGRRLESWTETDFGHALRDGKRPNGSAIDPFMPVRTFRFMTDEEVRALWLFVRSK